MRPIETLLLALLLALAPAHGAPEGPTGRFFEADDRPVPGEYLVVFGSDHPAAEVASRVADDHAAIVRTTWSHALNGALFGGLNEARARAMSRRPDVLWVEENRVISLDATQTNPPSWGLDRVDERPLPLSSSYTYDFDGTGVHAYVIDTGIRPTHNDFGGRASADHDTIGDGQNGIDCNGHGTHVAGTLGGSSFGIAKNVRLHAVRVLDCSGNGTVATVVGGIDWVTANHESPAVANMSLGGGASATLDAALNNSVAAGVFYAVAAGNDDTDACTQSPARAASAYTVGSTTINDVRSSFSNFGLCVKVFAPGSSITSTWSTSDAATATISGTSMASPHVAGAAALILDESPGLSPTQVVKVLTDRATCDVVGDRGSGSPDKVLYTLFGAPAGCAATCDVSALDSVSIVGTETHHACRSLRAGPALTVAGGGSLTLESGATVALSDGFQVESGGRLTVRTCSHSLCQTGTRLTSSCHGCVSSICAADSFCCNAEWDGICVGEVASVCGLTCP